MSNVSRKCGCKGCRTCLICEEEYGSKNCNVIPDRKNGYVYCMFCDKIYEGWDMDLYKEHPHHNGDGLNYPGIYIQLDFLSEIEEEKLMNETDSIIWENSQSGRRKQNYGPKCNFKKRKIKLGDFEGFPKYSEFVKKKFDSVPILREFQTIEQCFLEYNPKTGASIDPHIDDCWVWGERIITVNLLSDSVLTMTYNDKPTKYNLDSVCEYPSVMSENGGIFNVKPYDVHADYPIIRIPMPRRSLLVMYGNARYNWEHRILREDIESRRVCIAYREFTPPFLEGGKDYSIGKDILSKSKNFF